MTRLGDADETGYLPHPAWEGNHCKPPKTTFKNKVGFFGTVWLPSKKGGRDKKRDGG